MQNYILNKEMVQQHAQRNAIDFISSFGNRADMKKQLRYEIHCKGNFIEFFFIQSGYTK